MLLYRISERQYLGMFQNTVEAQLLRMLATALGRIKKLK
jgi:hypothetical protein